MPDLILFEYQMNKSDRNTQLQETIVYIIVWTFVAILPIFIECWECVNGKSFEWKPVYRWWIGMIPLISLFLLNNHLLIPHLLKKGKITNYLLAVSVMMIVFMVYQHNTIPDFIKPQKDFPPPPFEIKADKPPRPTPPMRLPLPELFMLALGMMTVGVNVAISLAFEGHRSKILSKDLENFKLQEDLKYLKHQIIPHFFMNVLNNIHEMSEEDSIFYMATTILSPSIRMTADSQLH